MTQNKKFLGKGVGRRKSAIAQVFIFSGTGSFVINNQSSFLYMQQNLNYLFTLNSPLFYLKKNISLFGQFDIIVKVKGGGLSGQAKAIQLGLARALCLNSSNKNIFKKQGFLTRDSRVKERRKFGLKKARKASQYSKR